MATISKLFERASKKHDLSNKSSNNDEEPKRQRQVDEPSLYSPTMVDELFTEKLEKPMMETLIGFLKRIEEQIVNLKQMVEKTQEQQIKGDKHLNELQKSIEYMTAKFDDLEKEKEKKDLEIKFKEEVSKLKEDGDRQSQYSRRNCLLVHGLPEEKNEKTDSKAINLIKEKLGIELDERDIDRSHRLGKLNNGKTSPRPIIVKFSSTMPVIKYL